MRITPQFGALLPDELKATPQWLLWRRELRHGAPTKVPFDFRSRQPGSVTDRSIYLPFARARDLAADDPFYEGIGFAVTGADPYCGVDLDHCLDDAGVLAAWARPIVDRLDSYTEVTPSGEGLRVWVRAKLPPKGRRKGKLGADGRGGIELYDDERYFTATGDRYARSPDAIFDRQEALDAIHAEFWPPKAEQAERPRPRPALLPLDDRELLGRMFSSRNGAAIRALFDGDLGDKHSGSEADLALCSHLAFWCGGDVDRIDRLFRQSGLCDAKWEDRADYRAMTIAKACDGQRFYDPNYHRAAREFPGPPPGGDPAPPRGGRDPGDDADEAEFFRWTDKGNAMRLVALHGADLRHCHPWKSWLIWRGDRWQVDETASIFRRAYDVIDELHREADAEEDDKKKAKRLAWALATEGDRRINAMVGQARNQRGIPVLPADFDRPPMLLNCPNGTVDLATGRLEPHVRGDLLTKRTAAPFDPDAEAPAWEAFLRRVMADDAGMVDFLARAVGYAASGSIAEQCLFFLYGHGRNGKSTFLNAIQEVLGDYACTINSDLLVAKNSEDHPTGVADLQGRRFVATIEVEDGKRMAESLVKTLTGGDKIRARRMRQDFFEFDPTHKLFLAANHKPTIRGTDDGIWRRIKLIPFVVQIPEGEVDRSLPDRLRAEGPGILAWVVRGCLEWRRAGLAIPEAVLAATRDYRSEMDYLGEFLEECCEVHVDLRCRPRVVYQAFVRWSRDTGGHPPTSNKFGRMLTDRGFALDRSNSDSWRLGLRVREEYLPHEPSALFENTH